jgi:hypothetical protein
MVDTRHLDPLLTHGVIHAAPWSSVTPSEPDDSAERAVALDAAIEAAEGRLEALAYAFAEGDLDVPAYQAATKALASRVAVLRAERSALVVDLRREAARPDLTTLAETFEGLPLETKRAVADRVIERVTVHSGRAGRFDPSRVRVEWRFNAPAVID